MPASLIAEDIAVVGMIKPVATVAGTTLTAAIDMSLWTEVMFIVQLGTLGASATVAFKVTESATSSGTYTDITGRAITTLTDAGTDSLKQAVLRVRPEQQGAGMRYIKGSLTVAVATSDVAVIAVGVGRQLPSTDNDLTSVKEIVK
jgi:hypothetical protein